MRAVQGLAVLVALVALATLATLAHADPCTSLTQRPALLLLFEELNGPAWFAPYSSGWTVPTSDPCCYGTACAPWAGLVCANGSVVSILIQATNAVANFSSGSVCAICGLQTLQAFQSPLVAPLPACLTAMPLASLALAVAVDGEPTPLPGVLLDMSVLTELFLFGNIGLPLPNLTSIGWAAGGLVSLGFGGAQWAAPLPTQLLVPSLRLLTCVGCGLVGAIPNALGTLAQLESLHLSQNALEGELADDVFARLDSLVSLDLSFNALSGTVGQALGNLTTRHLRAIALDHNALVGPIDALFVPGSRLESLTLASNQLSGPLPPTVAHARALTTLLLASNAFSGTIPAALESLDTLARLDLSGNAFTSADPSLCLACMPSLKVVSLRELALEILPPVFELRPDNTIRSSVVSLDCSRLVFGAPQQNNTLFSLLMALVNTSAVNTTFTDVSDFSFSYANLQQFSIWGAGLQGPLTARLFSLFPLMQNIYLGYNSFSGPLPQPEGWLTTDFLSAATHVSLAANQFVGELPAAYLEAMTGMLTLLDITLMDVSLTIPSFASQVDEFSVQNASLAIVCPSLAVGSSELLADPEEYSFVGCTCAPGYFGAVQADGSGCKPVDSLCSGSESVGACATSNGSVLTVLPGFWPAPEPQAATALLACPREIESAPIACNPSGTLTCVPLPGPGGRFTCGPPENVCSPSTRGRLCARCAPNMFHAPEGCQVCPPTTERRIGSLILLLVLSIFLAMFVRHSSRPPSDAAESAQREISTARFRIIAVIRIYWIDFALAFSNLVICGLGLAVFPGVLPRSVSTFVGLISLLFNVYYLIARQLPVRGLQFRASEGQARARAPSELERTARLEDTPLPLFEMSPRRIRLHFNAINGLLKSAAIWIQMLAVLVVPRMIFADSFYGSFYLSFASPLTFVSSCVISDSVDIWRLVASFFALPLWCFLVFAAVACVRYAFVRHAYRARVQRALGMYDEHIRMAHADSFLRENSLLLVRGMGSFVFLVLYAWLFFVLQVFFELLQCSSFDLGAGNGVVRYMTLWPDLLCYESTHLQLVAYASVFTLLYMGLYVFSLVSVVREGLGGRLGDTHTVARFGLVYESYRPSLWWFELVIAARRAALVFLATVLPYGYPRLIIVLLVLALSFVAHCYRPPYLSRLANLLDALASLQVLVLFATVSIAQPNSTAPAVHTGTLRITLWLYVGAIAVPFVRLFPMVRISLDWLLRFTRLDTALVLLYGKSVIESAPENANSSSLADDEQLVSAVEIEVRQRALEQLNQSLDIFARRESGLEIRCAHELGELENERDALRLALALRRGDDERGNALTRPLTPHAHL